MDWEDVKVSGSKAGRSTGKQAAGMPAAVPQDQQCTGRRKEREVKEAAFEETQLQENQTDPGLRADYRGDGLHHSSHRHALV